MDVQAATPVVMEAKYELLNRGGILQCEYDTAKFVDVGGLEKLKHWLTQRKPAFIKKLVPRTSIRQ